LGGNVAEQTDKIYRDSVISPRQTMLERLINRFVLSTFEGEDWAFALLAIDVEDELMELELAIGLFEHGALTPNDLIRAFGMRYDVEASNEAALNTHYINGVAIDGVVPTEVEAVMFDLRAGLLEIASKYAESSDEDGTFGSQLFGVLAGLEAGVGTVGNGGAPNGVPAGGPSAGRAGGFGQAYKAARRSTRYRAGQRAARSAGERNGDGDA